MKKIISSVAVALVLLFGLAGDASAAVVRYHSTTRVHTGVHVVPPAAPGPVVRGGVTVAHGSTVVARAPVAHPVAVHRALRW